MSRDGLLLKQSSQLLRKIWILVVTSEEALKTWHQTQEEIQKVRLLVCMAENKAEM